MKKEYMIPQSIVVDMVLKNSLLAGSEKMEKISDTEVSGGLASEFFGGNDTDNEDW